MLKIIVAFAFAITVAGTLPALGAENCLEWTVPGSNVNRRSLEDTVAVLTKDAPHLREALWTKYRSAVVTLEDVERAFAEHSYTEAEKQRIRNAFAQSRKQFWGIGGLAKLQIPPEFRQTLSLMIKNDPEVYVPLKIEEGFVIEDFLFGTRASVRCAVYRPASGQPRQIVLNKFEIEDGDVVRTFYHSEECSNAGRGKPRAKPTAPRATAPTPLTLTALQPMNPMEPAYTTWTQVYEVLDRTFLTEINDKFSRDLGDIRVPDPITGKVRWENGIVTRAVKAGRIRLYQNPPGQGEVEVELNGMDWEKLHRSPIGVNSSRSFMRGATFATNFVPPKNALNIPLVNGEAQLTYSPASIADMGAVSLRLHSLPANVTIAHKGPVMHTCNAPRAKTRCDKTELDRLAKQAVIEGWQWTRYFYFVEEN